MTLREAGIFPLCINVMGLAAVLKMFHFEQSGVILIAVVPIYVSGDVC